jgi:bifunctional non-homologous end joining protein LigD
VDVSRWFPEVAEALAAIDAARTVLDGHVCVLDAAGRCDVRRLHERALQPGLLPGGTPVVLCVQDVLVHEGDDVRALPCWKRRRLLRGLLVDEGPVLRRQRSVVGQGEWLAEQARVLGRSALLAKRLDAPYRGGPSRSWLSISCTAEVALERV